MTHKFVDPKSHFSKEKISTLLEFFPDGAIYLDLETTGLSPLVDKVIEISAIKIDSKGEIFTFSSLVNPIITIPEFSTRIHGITDEMVNGARYIGEVLPDFLDFVGDYALIAHNAKFDLGFIVYSAHQESISFSKSKVYDSCKFSRQCFPDASCHKLGVLATELGVPLENHHRALDDALAGMLITIRCLELSKTGGLTKEAVMTEAYLFAMDDFKQNKDFTIPQHLLPLKKTILTKGIVEIMYKGGSHKNAYRPIRPFSFLPLPNGNVLYAYCLLTDLHKSFALTKIKDIRYPSMDEIRKLAKKIE